MEDKASLVFLDTVGLPYSDAIPNAFPGFLSLP